MKFLLIQPPLEDFYTTPIRLYPLGLLYVAGTLMALGQQVEILDCLAPLKKRQLAIPDEFGYLGATVKNNPYFFKHYYRFGLSNTEIVSAVQKSQPDWIGISANFTAYYQSVDELVHIITRETGIPIFIGGNHATLFATECKQRTPAIETVLTGAAESALPSFVASLTGDKTLPNQIDWRQIQPAHHLLPAEQYRIGKKLYVSLIASRGCPYHCDFCNTHRLFGRQTTYRSITDLLAEMDWNYLNKGTRIFNFEDDNLSYHRDWLVEFLRALILDPVLQGIELTAMNGICYPTLDEELLRLMKTAGFRQLNLSYVTHSQALRRQFHRPSQQDQIEENFAGLIKTAQRLGFFLTVYVIIGLPGQTYTEVKDSIDYLYGLGVLVGPSVLYHTPGSALFERWLRLHDSEPPAWNSCRSSAFAVETASLSREQLIDLFCYTRKRNLAKRRRG